jgi:hypothetical protein
MSVNKRVHTDTNNCNIKTHDYGDVVYCIKSWYWLHVKWNSSQTKQEKRHFKTTFNKAVIGRCMSFRFIFAMLHVLLVNVWDLLYQKYKCLSQNNIHTDEQSLLVDDTRYHWLDLCGGLCAMKSYSQYLENYWSVRKVISFVSYSDKFFPVSKSGVLSRLKGNQLP